MTDATRRAILALVCVDETATPAEKDAVERAIRPGGGATCETVTQAEAARRLGVSDRTVRNLIRRGSLRCAGGRGGGRVTAQSIIEYTR